MISMLAGAAPASTALALRLVLGLGDGVLPPLLLIGEDAVDLAANLGDGGADGVGDRRMLGNAEGRNAGEFALHQDAAAAHQDRRHRLCARLHTVDRVLHHNVDFLERTPHGRAVQPGDGLTVADIGEARRDGDVGGGERAAAEDQRLLG